MVMRVLMAIFWTAALVSLVCAQGPSRQAPRPPAKKALQVADWPEAAEGVGMDEQNAKEDAWREARKKILECLRRLNLTAWEPSVLYVKTNLVRSSERGEDLEIDGGGFKKWIVHLKSPDWEQIYKLDRDARKNDRAQERMLQLGKILAGALVLLAGIAGYIRLDDWTKGYYTRWLQLGGGVLLAATCAALWLT
jgi:hypothetical protein